MKIVFLDIDGVLNSTRTCVAHGGYPFDFDEKDMAQFDHTAIALVRGIVKAAGAQVVLSSAWRITHAFSDVARAFDMPIIDRTPSLCGCRGDEIKSWLGDHPEVERYAIIDDSGDMLAEQTPFFVQTDMHEGFLWRDAEKLAGLLGLESAYEASPGRTRAPGFALAWE